MPRFDANMLSPPMGVVFVLDDEDANPEYNVVDTVGSLLMAARIANISDRATEIGENTVRIVVGGKP